MKPVIFVTRRIPQPALDRLAEVFDVKVYPEEKPISKTELQQALAGADALLCLLTDTIDQELIEGAPKLKCISNYAVGYNNIDVKFATQMGIAVCNTPGVLSESTADLAWALIMSCCRRIVESDSYVRAGRFTGWEPMLMLGHDVFGKTLGIIGMGRIGQAVARRAWGFDMRVVYYSPTSDPTKLHADWQPLSLQDLCREADIISIHAPLTAKTKHLIGAPELALLQPHAVLINTARGAIVDEVALIRALQEKKIAAAGLDVFEDEPHIPPELLALSNVVLLPHIGSASCATRTKMGLLAAENAIAVIQGRTPPAKVN